MTKEEFRSCCNDKLYEYTLEEQKSMIDWMYDNMCVWTAYTNIATKRTFCRDWLKGYKIKDMDVNDWKEWRRKIAKLEKQIENDKKIEEINKDFE